MSVLAEKWTRETVICLNVCACVCALKGGLRECT